MTKSEARKLYWSQVPANERSRRGTIAAKSRWAKTSPEQRSEYARMMLYKRFNKQPNVIIEGGNEGRDLPGSSEPSSVSPSGQPVDADINNTAEAR